ncbi:MAG TPA: hypothetical protein VGQ53_01580 [Chitinophagaceae bacterium]|nr:hypothetical protein [Chitinophagaceae bacterium]
MGFFKFRNQNHFPILLSALASAVIHRLRMDCEFLLQSQKNIAATFADPVTISEKPYRQKLKHITKFDKLIRKTLKPEQLDFAFHEFSKIEVWLMDFKIRERWWVLPKNEKDKFPANDFYNSELAVVFRPDKDDDSIYQEFERFFVGPSIKISERLFRPLMIESGMDLDPEDSEMGSIEGQIREVLMSHWIYLYVTIDDDIIIPGINDPTWPLN